MLYEVGGAVENGGFARIHELDLQWIVLVAHDFQLFGNIAGVFHHQGVEIAEAENLGLVFIGDDDGSTYRIERDLFHKVVDHAFQYGFQLGIDQGFVVVQILNQPVTRVDFDGWEL